MKETFISTRNSIISFLYKNFGKKLFFLIDPERIHDLFTTTGELLAKFWITRKITAFFFKYSNKSLEQEILGIKFKNPVGLAAGFDKDARMINTMHDTGFGFTEVGSITGYPCAGNSGTRLWRLKKSQGLVVYYGLKNKGSEKLAKKLRNKKFDIPVGVSIAKTNCKETIDEETGIKDYVKAYKEFQDIGDYITVNISCPNAYGGEPFSDPEKLDRLLTSINKEKATKPVLLKMPLEMTDKEMDELIEVAEKHNISGFICSNLSKKRDNQQVMKNVKEKELPKSGSISGKPMEELATKNVSRLYKKTKGKYVIVGCGGVFTAKDAYKKIKAGASLIQMITGMIYKGPQAISSINQGLTKLLEKDGYANISEAVGVDHE